MIQQKGSSLIVTLIFIAAMTLIVLYTAKVSVIEQKMSGNSYRSSQSFEAANAGIEMMTSALLQTMIDTNGDGAADSDLHFDTNNDGNFDQALPLVNQISAAGSSDKFTISFSDLAQSTPVSLSHVLVTSAGISQDGRAASIIQQEFAALPTLATLPLTTLTAKGSVTLNGSSSLKNTDIDPDFVVIRAGGATTLSANIIGSDGSRLLSSSSSVQQSDSSLPSDSNTFFRLFFSQSKGVIKPLAQHLIQLTGDGVFNGQSLSNRVGRQTGSVIWIDGLSADGSRKKVVLNGGTKIGINASNNIKPVIIVIENASSIEITGNVEIYGLLYIIGDFNATSSAFSLTGGLVVEGNLTQNSGIDLKYDANILEQLRGVGRLAKLPGSWSDF
jgi:hypothetical protein